MERQYYAPRCRYLPNGQQAGIVPVGMILYLPDGVGPFRRPAHPVLREPWRVEAWIPREAPYFDVRSRRLVMRRCAGGHFALVRSLRTGQCKTVADWSLLASVDEGWTRE